MGFLTKITNLNLANNLLETLPPEISSMTSLTSLDLTNNNLSDVPSSLQDLSHLGTAVTENISNDDIDITFKSHFRGSILEK